MNEWEDIWNTSKRGDGDAGARTGRFTVTELTRLIKNLIEENIPPVSVEGEVSNYVHHTSGHRYFTLKDENSQIRCVMFKWQSMGLDFIPEEGMKVLAVGNVTVYERGGQYQLTVLRLIPLGRGELLARLEELKKKLTLEGVFDNRRAIPSYPEIIGVVTSPTGAAVRDIISVLTRRAPHVQIVLRPSLVQGDGAAADIVQGIREINAHTDADVLIVGRGGGSIEDLWCFNEEIVARAIASSSIPVISAVGHETDFTLADFAADVRAPTPSAAAEIAVKDSGELREVIAGYRSLVLQYTLAKIYELIQKIETIKRGLRPERFIQFLMLKSQSVDELTLRIRGVYDTIISDREKVYECLKGKLVTLDPRAVLSRGFSIVCREYDNRVVTDRTMVSSGDNVSVEVARGHFRAQVID